MWIKEDNTFNDIRKRSVEQWLNDIEDNEDLVVRGGVKVTREYIEYLENEIKRLKDLSRPSYKPGLKQWRI